MNDTPIRHMLFLTVLLFVILSSGCLQCALNCYDRASEYSSEASLVANCHPLALEELAQSPTSTFCHHGHTSNVVERKTTLQSFSSGQLLALFPPKSETPAYRSADPVRQTFAVLILNKPCDTGILPPSQNLKQLRSTILLM